jgi:hypothetical protein
VYYDDDGVTYDYEKGVFFRQEIWTWADTNGTSLVLGSRTGDYSPALQWYTFKIHGGTCGKLTIDGKPTRQLSTLQELESSDGEGWASARDVYGIATYVKVRAGVARKIEALKGGTN